MFVLLLVASMVVFVFLFLFLNHPGVMMRQLNEKKDHGMLDTRGVEMADSKTNVNVVNRLKVSNFVVDNEGDEENADNYDIERELRIKNVKYRQVSKPSWKKEEMCFDKKTEDGYSLYSKPKCLKDPK